MDGPFFGGDIMAVDLICNFAGAACVAESVKHFSVQEYLTAFASSAQEISCFSFI